MRMHHEKEILYASSVNTAQKFVMSDITAASNKPHKIRSRDGIIPKGFSFKGNKCKLV